MWTEKYTHGHTHTPMHKYTLFVDEVCIRFFALSQDDVRYQFVILFFLFVRPKCSLSSVSVDLVFFFFNSKLRSIFLFQNYKIHAPKYNKRTEWNETKKKIKSEWISLIKFLTIRYDLFSFFLFSPLISSMFRCWYYIYIDVGWKYKTYVSCTRWMNVKSKKNRNSDVNVWTTLLNSIQFNSIGEYLCRYINIVREQETIGLWCLFTSFISLTEL